MSHPALRRRRTISFGTAGIYAVATDTVHEMLNTLEKHNVKELDTASIYVRSEAILVASQRSEIVTLSIGVASACPSVEGVRDFSELAEKLIAEADSALYRAKSAGRNRVEISQTVVS